MGATVEQQAQEVDDTLKQSPTGRTNVDQEPKKAAERAFLKELVKLNCMTVGCTKNNRKLNSCATDGAKQANWLGSIRASDSIARVH
jgi:hypothetical protein